MHWITNIYCNFHQVKVSDGHTTLDVVVTGDACWAESKESVEAIFLASPEEVGSAIRLAMELARSQPPPVQMMMMPPTTAPAGYYGQMPPQFQQAGHYGMMPPQQAGYAALPPPAGYAMMMPHPGNYAMPPQPGYSVMPTAVAVQPTPAQPTHSTNYPPVNMYYSS